MIQEQKVATEEELRQFKNLIQRIKENTLTGKEAVKFYLDLYQERKLLLNTIQTEHVSDRSNQNISTNTTT